jgi:hypothetical protein
MFISIFTLSCKQRNPDMITSKSFLTVLFLFTSLFTPLNAEDLIIDGESVYLAGDRYYDNVIITNGGILYLVEYGGSNEDQGVLQLYCDSLYIDASSAINGNNSGGQYGSGEGGQGSDGTGPGRRSGGGGGGFGGQGGMGGGDYPGSGGNSYGSNTELMRGSRGGWGYVYSSYDYDCCLTRGSGGGAIYINARVANIYGNIYANGQSGWQSNSSGNYNYMIGAPGGGSGGMIWLDIPSLLLEGSLSGNGGNGGDASSNSTDFDERGSGGAGGGGRISIVTESLIDLNLLNVSGGSGGDNGNGYPGLDGEDGVIYYLKTWLTSSTNPDQEIFYTYATPTMEMEAAGDIFGYFYEVVQDPDGVA